MINTDTLAESCLSKYSYIKVTTDAVLSFFSLFFSKVQTREEVSCSALPLTTKSLAASSVIKTRQ